MASSTPLFTKKLVVCNRNSNDNLAGDFTLNVSFAEQPAPGHPVGGAILSISPPGAKKEDEAQYPTGRVITMTLVPDDEPEPGPAAGSTSAS